MNSGLHVRTKVVIESRGLNAEPNAEFCSRALRGIVDKDELAAFAAHHTPRPLTATDLDGADLILTAGLEQRAASVRMSLAVRERTFTLIEAARLADHVRRSTEIPDDLRGEDRLTWLVEQMDDSRGALAIFPSQRRRSLKKPWQTAAYSDLDIPDPHLNDAVAHTIARRRIEDATQLLGSSINFAFAPSLSLT